MIHVFHGDHHEQSRKELSLLRERFKQAEIVVLNGKVITLTELKQATESTSLFGTDRLVVIENFLSKRFSRKTDDNKPWINWIKQIPETVEVVFWE